jgi:hypothetical protein
MVINISETEKRKGGWGRVVPHKKVVVLYGIFVKT